MEIKDLELKWKIFWIIFLIILSIEIGYWIYLYKTSDEVDCNLIWCTFTKESTEEFFTSSTIITSLNSTINQTCFINGEEVNCSNIEEYLP